MSAPATPGRHLLPFAIHAERRLETPRGLGVATTVGAVAVALLISALLIRLIGGDPINAYAHIVRSSLGSIGVLSDTLVKATPLIFTGLACSVAFRMRLWNIGAEGQLMMGAWGASAVVLVGWLPEGTPSLVYLPLMMAAGIAAGALWAGIAGWLKARLNVNEIITTLMLVYISFEWVKFWVFGPWSDGGFQMSPRFPREAWLPRLTDNRDSIDSFGGLTVHLGVILAVVAASLVGFFLNRNATPESMDQMQDNLFPQGKLKVYLKTSKI